MSNDYLFDTSRDALMFAFRFCGQQYAKAPELMKGKVIGSGKGLIGLDGAGQAGFISREARSLPKAQFYALLARFTDRFNPCTKCGTEQPTDEWMGACKWLAEEYRIELAPEAHIKLMTLLVQRHFSPHKRSLADIATFFGDGLSKVKHINAKLSPALKKLEGTAQAKIDERLTYLGIVHSDSDEAAA
jgi:hypothetical protein